MELIRAPIEAEESFYSDSEDEDFSKYLDSEDDEDVNSNSLKDEFADLNLEKGENIELPEDFDAPAVEESEANHESSLLDSLLGDVLSGEQILPPTTEMLNNLKLNEEFEKKELEDLDSGISIGASRSVSAESQFTDNKEENKIHIPPIQEYLQFIREEENAVSEDDIPDFSSKKNVYGTSFNLKTGALSRPPQFEFSRRDDRWVETGKELTYESVKTLKELFVFGRKVTTVKRGMKIDRRNCKFTDVHFRNADEFDKMETIDIQKIIRDSFNSRRLAVIFFGVDSDGAVRGCHMSAERRDNLRLALDTAIQTEFVPPIENILDAIDLHLVPVENVDDSFLIIIRVKQLRNRTYQLESAV